MFSDMQQACRHERAAAQDFHFAIRTAVIAVWSKDE
jgi:hypothetical protein